MLCCRAAAQADYRLESSHPVILRIVLDLGQSQCFHHWRHVHPEAATKTLLQAIPAANRILRRASPGFYRAFGRGPLLVEESGWRLVWPEEGSSWPLRDVRASSDGSIGTGRGRAQSEEQPDASSLADNLPAPLLRQHSISNLSNLCCGRGKSSKNFRYGYRLQESKLWLK